MDSTFRQLFLRSWDFIKLASRLILEMSLVELDESHYFVQIKLCVKIEVQCGSKVVNRVVTEIYTVAFAIVDKMCDTINIILL